MLRMLRHIPDRISYAPGSRNRNLPALPDARPASCSGRCVGGPSREFYLETLAGEELERFLWLGMPDDDEGRLAIRRAIRKNLIPRVKENE